MSGLPRVIVGPEQAAVYWNETGSLQCSATGYPVPSITWSRVDGKPLPSTVDATSPVLLFESVQPGDEAEYTCTAQNSIDFSLHTATGNSKLAVMG